MKRIHDNINNVDYDISYYRSGLRSQMNRPYSLKTDYTYDVLGRLERVEHSRNQVSLQKFEYTYDVDLIDGSGAPLYKGYRTERSMITSGGTVDQQYAYNERGWLTVESHIISLSFRRFSRIK